LEASLSESRGFEHRLLLLVLNNLWPLLRNSLFEVAGNPEPVDNARLEQYTVCQVAITIQAAITYKAITYKRIRSTNEFNPSELHVVREGRFIVQPASAESCGHLTMAHPKLWSERVAEFMRSLGMKLYRVQSKNRYRENALHESADIRDYVGDKQIAECW
jgi:hypothetical protein